MVYEHRNGEEGLQAMPRLSSQSKAISNGLKG